MAKPKSKGKASATKLNNKQNTKLAKRGKLKQQKIRHKERLKEKKQAELQGPTQQNASHIEHIHEEIVEDEGYFEQADIGFAKTISKESATSKKKRKGNVEDIFASSKRHKQWVDEEEHTPLLPIKERNKVIQRSQKKYVNDEEPGESGESGVDVTVEACPLAEGPPPDVSIVDLMAQRERKLAQRKAQIANMCCAIVENPQENVRKLRDMRGMWDDEKTDIQTSSRKLIMMSLTEIFKDILPDYTIRITSQTEKQQAASADTKQLRNYEENLLNNYKMFLQILETCIGSYKDNQKIKREKTATERTLRALAVKCLCQVFAKRPTFNFSKNIITVLVPLLASHNHQIFTMVCDTVKQIFKEDKKGLTSLELVRAICKMVKTRNYHVHPSVLDVFLALKIKEVRTENSNTKKLTHKEKMKQLSRSERKRDKKRKELDKQLEEAAVEVNTNKILQTRTDIIAAIFTLYFFILKKEQDSKLLSPVLEGLAKFAHLINVDFFSDLFKVFKQLLETDTLCLEDVLNITQTAFTILSGQGQALNIDPSHFYSHVYKILPSLTSLENVSLIPKLLTLLRMMFIDRRKQVSRGRVLAYIKRLSTISLQLPPPETIAILAITRSMVHTFPYSDTLFDKEPVGSGIYLPNLDEPEHCNAHNTNLDELHGLKHHYSPTIAIFAKHMSRGAPLHGEGCLTGNIARKTAEELMVMVAKESTPDYLVNRSHDQLAKSNSKKLKINKQEFIQPLMNKLCSKHMMKDSGQSS